MGALLGFQFTLWAEAKFSASQEDSLDGGQSFDPEEQTDFVCINNFTVDEPVVEWISILYHCLN